MMTKNIRWNGKLYQVVGHTDNLFQVVERSSGIVVKNYNKLYDARAQAIRLEQGAGFAGWTPPFFVRNDHLANIPEIAA